MKMAPALRLLRQDVVEAIAFKDGRRGRSRTR
jgi:hypothetical protein